MMTWGGDSERDYWRSLTGVRMIVTLFFFYGEMMVKEEGERVRGNVWGSH